MTDGELAIIGSRAELAGSQHVAAIFLRDIPCLIAEVKRLQSEAEELRKNLSISVARWTKAEQEVVDLTLKLNYEKR